MKTMKQLMNGALVAVLAVSALAAPALAEGGAPPDSEFLGVKPVGVLPVLAPVLPGLDPAFFEIWDQITDDDLSRTVEAYGTSFPAVDFLGFTYDEHWHHRGQFTVYLRLRGVEPIMIYDYGRLHG